MPRRGQSPTNVVLGGLCVVGLLTAACGAHRTPAEERAREAARQDGEVVVAAVWPWERRADIRYGEGLQLAVEEVNAGGGIRGRPLRLQRYDDHESLDDGMVIAQQIASAPRVMAVLGHLQSYVTVPASAVYEQAGLVMIAPAATDPALTGGGRRRIFRATFTDQDTGRQLATFLGARFQRVAICYVRNNYGRNLANAFEARASEIGLVVAARQSYDPSEQVSARSFDETVKEWKALDVDAIFIAGEVPSGGLFVAQARAAGLDIPMIGGDAMAGPALLTSAGRAAEGMIVSTFFHPDERRPEAQRFRAAFERRFGTSPDAGSAIGYDVVQVLVQAMRKAGTVAPDAVAGALHLAPPWPGVTGPLRFDENGAALGKRLVLMVVRDGRFVYVPDEPAALETAPTAGSSN
jgi:branched-chain amino acid transport system substrate-binding protein